MTTDPLPTTNYQLPTTNYQLPITHSPCFMQNNPITVWVEGVDFTTVGGGEDVAWWRIADRGEMGDRAFQVGDFEAKTHAGAEKLGIWQIFNFWGWGDRFGSKDAELHSG